MIHLKLSLVQLVFYDWFLSGETTVNHKRCNTTGFREDGTSKLETRFRLSIFNIISLRRTFQSIVSHLVLSCVIKTCTHCIVHGLCSLTDNISPIRYTQGYLLIHTKPIQLQKCNFRTNKLSISIYLYFILLLRF